MTTHTKTRKHKTVKKSLWNVTNSIPDEMLIFCPSCKALDVVRFSGQQIIPTRKFIQHDDKVFHTCGSNIPCRLHRQGGSNHLTITSNPRLPSIPSQIPRSGRTRVLVNV